MSSPETLYVNLYEPISDFKVKNIMQALGTLVADPQQRPQSLYVLFSSHGGALEPAAILYYFIKSLPIEVIMHSTGNIDSSGLLVFLAAKKRFAPKHSTFLIHSVTWSVLPNFPYTRDAWSEQEGMWSASETKFCNIVSENCTLKDSEIREMFRLGKVKDANFALERGIIHGIKDPLVPPDAKFFPFNIPEPPRLT